jgi:Domain of unknown function (DUF4384)/Sel1 repeat
MAGIGAFLPRFIRGGAVAAITAMLMISPATAGSAGRDAFLKGDFAQAEREWRRDAAQGDEEAEFGLGELYEQIREDYPEAERWYARAAERGSIKARYRLALIALAGNTKIAPDPVEAYKWSILASDASDKWGRLAEDLRSQLDGVLTDAERGEGKRQAELWLRRQAPGSGPAPSGPAEQVTSAAAATVAPAPGSDGPSRSPPTVASVAPQPARPRPSLADDEKALVEAMQRVRCASLRRSIDDRGKPVIAGTVPDEGEKSRLLGVLAAFAPENRPEIRIRVVPPPLCQSLSGFDSLRAASIVADGLHARLQGSGSTLREGDPIRIEVRAANYPVHVRIDYFSLDGRVLHMLPNQKMPAVTLAADDKRVLGSGDDWLAGGPPFGTELILVIATPKTLDLGLRPLVEDAATYLSALERELRRSATTAVEPNLLTTMLVETRAK